MATNFPTSLDTLTNPTATDTLDSPPHDTQHADANDAIEAIQAKVGIDSSAVTTSLDYRVGQLELGGGSMTTSSTAPSSPSDGDMWYDTDDGRTYVYYDDGTSQQWVEFGAPAVQHGKILQVVTATYSTTESTTSSTYVDTSLTATITPSDTTSKILVLASVSMAVEKNASYNTGSGYHAIERGGSQLVEGRHRSYSNLGTAFRTLHGHVSLVCLDSPATTSATTYTVQHKQGESGTVYTFIDNRVGTLTLLEVAG